LIGRCGIALLPQVGARAVWRRARQMPLNLLRQLLSAGDGGGRLHRGRQLLDDLLEQDLLVAFAQAVAGGVGRGLDRDG